MKFLQQQKEEHQSNWLKTDDVLVYRNDDGQSYRWPMHLNICAYTSLQLTVMD